MTRLERLVSLAVLVLTVALVAGHVQGSPTACDGSEWDRVVLGTPRCLP